VYPQAGALLALQPRWIISARLPVPGHRVGEHLVQRGVQCIQLGVVEAAGDRVRGELGDVQDLVAVGVADAGDDFLVGDDGLDPAGVSGQPPGQVVGGQLQRVRS